ncbi:hypothetical protein A2U01_0086219, partial [Trifolium medium]|nr:hypothetical protein [Trifolium medium]
MAAEMEEGENSILRERVVDMAKQTLSSASRARVSQVDPATQWDSPTQE